MEDIFNEIDKYLVEHFKEDDLFDSCISHFHHEIFESFNYNSAMQQLIMKHTQTRCEDIKEAIRDMEDKTQSLLRHKFQLEE